MDGMKLTDNDVLESAKVTRDDLMGLFESGKSFVAHCLKDGGKMGFTPTLIIMARASVSSEPIRVMVVIGTDFNEWQEKSGILRRMGAEFYDKKLLPMAAVMASECWVSKQCDKDNITQPRHDPNKKEAIQVSCATLFTLPRMAFGELAMVTRASDETMLVESWDHFQEHGVNGITLEMNLLEQVRVGFIESVKKRLGGFSPN